MLAQRGAETRDAIGGTEQTIRRLRRCTIAKLAASPMTWPDGRPVLDRSGEPRNRLETSQVRAALDIEAHFAAIGRGLWARASAYDVVSTAGRQLRNPVGQLTDRDAERMDARYKPWATLEAIHRIGSTTALEIVVDAVIDNLGCGQIDNRHGLRKGTAYRELFGSLARYCRVSGWHEPDAIPERAGGPDHGEAHIEADSAGPIDDQRSRRQAGAGERPAPPAASRAEGEGQRTAPRPGRLRSASTGDAVWVG